MSTSLDNHGSPWRKRTFDEFTLDLKDLKKPRLNYYRLESESSKASDDGTESICSLQERETDFVQDSSDLSTDCEEKGSEYDVQFEYEVASLSENDGNLFEGSTTDSEDMMLAAAAAVICQNSFEGWVTDVEDSDSSTEESSFKRTDFATCVQCKGENINPMYRYCDKCFQDRKKHFPPRPKRRRNRRKKVATTPPLSESSCYLPVKLDTLRSCLNGLQNSGLGSSPECPSFGLDQIVVPEHLQSTGTSKTDDFPTNPLDTVQPENVHKVSKTLDKSPRSPSRCLNTEKVNSQQKMVPSLKRNRTSSESSVSEYENTKKFKASESHGSEQTTSDLGSEASGSALTSFSSVASSSSSGFFSENSLRSVQNRSSNSGSVKSDSDLCIFCNNAPKNSIFLHTNIAHCCCCYSCAKKTLRSTKRCPICNGAVNKVVRIFTT